MPKSHRPYAPEFRQRIIELVRKGRTPEPARGPPAPRRALDPLKSRGLVCAGDQYDPGQGFEFVTAHQAVHQVATQGCILMTGTVKLFKSDRCYGFIAGADGVDYFFHAKNCTRGLAPSRAGT